MGLQLGNFSRDLQESLKKILRDYAEALFFAVVLALLLRSFVVASYQVTNDSLSPHLEAGDFILGFKLPYGIRLPFSESRMGQARVRVGDFAIFSCTSEGRRSSCVKRLVGLAGDRIEVKNGVLYRNGEPQKDYSTKEAQFESLVVPPDHVFMSSERWGQSHDSFESGPVPVRDLEARASLVWFSKRKLEGVRWERLGKSFH